MTELSSTCIEWTGGRDKDGYGIRWFEGRNWRVHRLVWTLMYGPIEPGVMILHRCDNPPCHNIEHLYAGDGVDNMRDRSERGRHPKANQTECVNGHEFTEENTYYRRDRLGRQCRRCKRDRQRQYKERRRATT